ncbi:PREDICTED: pollen receptor-like kinase 4 [Nicotiana attenuata]|uniref:non-specific serine/threonine protein kinase n=1 Tax=Nicotiana attenuata TaxID=49451 RepID=A0A314KT03_NICAT|nr:PREDICTED: pollen receptor-like kinase 4 [Nicotiana attenuata]OIT31874.1 pollen receptor-like kinase 4 [Nicotiana attenuata]
MASSARNHHYLTIVIITCLIASSSSSEQEPESSILLKFKSSLANATSALGNWDSKVQLCKGNFSNWKGLICYNGKFTGLQLESMGLSGTLDIDTLSQLTSLRTISVMNNNFEGPFPDVKKLGGLRGVYLSNNRFSGDLPDDAFAGMKSIRRVYMANNGFTGKIPTSLLEIPKLVELQLQDNQFDGSIPAFGQQDFHLNVANNRLEGPIPAQLSSQSLSSFAGNVNLCGKPMAACPASREEQDNPPRGNTSNKKKGIPIVAIILAVIGGLLVGAIIIAFFLLRRQRKRPCQYEKSSVKNLNKSEPKKPLREDKYGRSEKGKLYFVRRDREKFDLEDLLRAPAEVLGSGSFGSTYKADVNIGKPIAVRRFRQMSNMGKEDFHEHMRKLGKLSHPNILPLVAFYYRREEKLLVTDFAENGSLASHLHGKRGPKQPNLDWPSRLKIIKGVSRGLAYLYEELPTLTLPHGHLKSSNVVLDHNFEPLLADYALVPVINKDHAKQFMVAYKSPEYMQNERLTRKTDVWSLGILILELLTGRFPANYLKQGKGANADLEAWVNSVVREEWTGEVFDKDMNTKIKHNSEGEMLKLLKIGMCCCEMDVGRRWDLREALEKIEELKERDTEYFF